MGELLNRQFQRDILERLGFDYPDNSDLGSIFGEISNTLRVNLSYLEEHGMLTIVWPNHQRARSHPIGARITAKGLDFLADDGGLTAILGVVTVRIDEDQLKKILIDQVRKSDNTKSTKARLIEVIRGLPADVAKEAVMTAAKSGIGHVPDIAHWIANLGEMGIRALSD